MTKNNRGWRGESHRHSLARKGIKTATNPRTNIANKQENVGYSGRIGATRFKVSKGEAEFLQEMKDCPDCGQMRMEGIIPACCQYHLDEQQKVYNDTDGDGMPDRLDCDPNDPDKQGFFDNIKKKLTKELSEAEIAKLRADLEAREEKLEQKKEAKLLKQQSTTAKQRELAELKAKEKELDMLQEEVEKSSKKARLKSAAQRTGILAKKSYKRIREEFADKEPKKFTKVTLTDEEKARTSTATQKKLEVQQKRNAELEAKVELKKLRAEEAALKKQLGTIRKKRAKKKTGLFD